MGDSEQELGTFLSSEKVKSILFSSKSIPQIIPQNEQHFKTRSSFSLGKGENDQQDVLTSQFRLGIRHWGFRRTEVGLVEMCTSKWRGPCGISA